MSDTKIIESKCFQWLPEVDVDFLTGFCEEYHIQVPEDKVGKKALLLKLVLRYLNSETLEQSDDQGKSVFVKLLRELEELFDIEQKVMPSLEKLEDVVGSTENMGGSKTGLKLSYHKLQQFKIKGVIGDSGQTDTMNYLNLMFQIKQGKAVGYSSDEVCAAVIQAIKPGNSLRDYLESKSDLTEDGLLQILRSHFDEKDSASYFQDLSTCVQQSGESAHKFCVRAMALRNKVASRSVEEECPFDANMLQNRFFHTIFTGLKQNSIRMELQVILKERLVSDEELLKEVSLAAANELDRQEKIKTKVDLNQLTLSETENSGVQSGSEKKCKPVKEPKENKILTEINKLTAKVNELTSVKSEIEELKKQLNQSHCSNTQNADSNPQKSGTSNNEYRRRKIYRCKNCESTNSQFCDHCFKCGSSDHRRVNCQKN